MKHSVSNYFEDNLKTARLEEDDSGLPENPIYSNFPKHLWKSHARNGLTLLPGASREVKNGRSVRDGDPLPKA